MLETITNTVNTVIDSFKSSDSSNKIFSDATNLSVTSIGSTRTDQDIYAKLMRQNNKSYHKSFDLSNVGMYPDEVSSDKILRQFHQTRIFIQDFGGMLHHGQINSAGNTQTYLISANLPESLGYSFGAKWEAPLASFGGSLFNAIMQFGGKKIPGIGQDLPSGINRAATMLIWGGSQPLSLSLNIPVIDDGYTLEKDRTGINTNLVEGLEFLGSLTLPRKQSALGFYTPPPSPLNYTLRYGKDRNSYVNFAPTGGRIMIQLGGILLIDNCVIKNIQVDYPNTKGMIRHDYSQTGQTIGTSGSTYLTPLLANIRIDITTVEALTSDTYSNMLWLKSQSGEGKGYTDASSVVEGAKNFVKSAGNILLGGVF